MQAGLSRFGSEAERIMSLFVEALPKDRLYHYTNDDGLRGILKSGQLWLTDVFKLNDPSEVSHGFDIGVKALTSSVANGTPQSKEFARVLEAFYNRVGIQGSAKFFVCSFSWHEDDLCQWRAYADNGRGYALEFDAAALDAVVKGEAHTEAFPITYADAGLDKLDCEIIDAYRRMIDIDQIMQSAPSNDDAGELYTGLIVQLLRAALFFKHPAYENENEYRLLQTYRAGEPILGIHKKLDWRSVQPKALKRIIVGPAAHREKACQFAQDCLQRFQTEVVPITCSAIPYRAVRSDP